MSDVFSQFGVSPDNYEYDPVTNSIKLKPDLLNEANTFNERWNLPVQPPSDIVGNIQTVPTIQQPPNPNLYGLPVEYQKSIPETKDERADWIKYLSDTQVSKGAEIGNRLFGTDPNVERFQTWPERMSRSGLSLPADVYEGRTPVDFNDNVKMEPNALGKFLGMTEKFNGPSPNSVIARAQDTAGMAGMGGIGMTPKGALGTGGSKLLNEEARLARAKEQGYNVNETLYRGQPNIDKLTEFTPDYIGGQNHSVGAAWFTDNPKVAGEYIPHSQYGGYKEGSGMMPSFIRGKQLDITAEYMTPEGAKALKKAYKSIGKDYGFDNFQDFNDVVTSGRMWEYGSNLRFQNAVLRELAETKGYSAVRLSDNTFGIPNDSVVVFDPANIRSKFAEFAPENVGKSGLLLEDTRAATGIGAINQSGFYSNLERTIANSKVEKATPEQWTSYLKNQPGIKGEELEFSLANLPNKQISKAELEQHITENGVKLGEVWKGNKLTPEQEQWLEIAANRKLDEAELKKFSELEAIKTSGEMNKTDTKFSSYQLPGGENYRELLLTVPGGMTKEAAIKQRDLSWNKIKELPDFPSDMNPMYQVRWAENNSGDLYKTWSEGNRISNGRPSEKDTAYRSSHWDEPNVLAHVRMNDREIPGVGKSLHLEEIQSDWGQSIRKQGGYKKDLEGDITKEYEAAKARGDVQGMRDANDKHRILLESDLIAQNSMRPPNMPFKKSWDELALKRALTEAVQQGNKKELENYHALIDSDPDKVAHALVKSGKLREICD